MCAQLRPPPEPDTESPLSTERSTIRPPVDSSICLKTVDPTLDLEGLIDARDLSVVFQPIVHLADESVFACEALARCSSHGIDSPLRLFSLAADVGKTGQLGRVLRELVFQVAIDLDVFVNVHPHELTQPWLLSPDDPIAKHPRKVYLEITETVPLGGFDGFEHALSEIRRRPNVHLVVDDLGAGFSNLRRISDLAPSIVKIDRNLITGLPESVRQQRLLRGIVRMCVDLGAKVVAEGIENYDEFSAARDAGTHFGQGFLWAKPAFPLPEARRTSIDAVAE